MVFICDLNSEVYTIIVIADYLFLVTVSNLQVRWKFTGFIIKKWFYFLIQFFVNLGKNTACL